MAADEAYDVPGGGGGLDELQIWCDESVEGDGELLRVGDDGDLRGEVGELGRGFALGVGGGNVA